MSENFEVEEIDFGKTNSVYARNRSTWELRNDSSNMSSLLAPNNHCIDEPPLPRKPRKPKKLTIYSSAKKPTKSWKAHCQTCYCQQPPQPPLLNMKPRTNSSTKEPKARKMVEGDGETPRSQQLLDEVYRKLSYTPRSIFLRRLKEEAHRKCNGLGCGGVELTARREDYENLVSLRERYEKEKRDRLEGDGSGSLGGRGSFGKEDDDSRLRGGNDDTDCECSKCNDRRVLEENSKKIDTLKEFRSNNYFQTHSSANLLQNQNVGDHKCIHRFTLDDRLMPVPENSDPYGLSRCAICNKPMLEEDLSKKSVDSRLRSRVSKGTGARGEARVGLRSLEPRKLYVPVKDEKVEVKLPLGLGLEDETSLFKTLKKPLPVSSMALRFQKGVA